MFFRLIPPRKPEKCFSHSATSYMVKPGDTMYKISLQFKVPLKTLEVFNRHILNPNILVPGDIICIPKHKPYCSLLKPTENAPKGSYATVIAGSDGISILADLPPIENVNGDYVHYFAYIVGPSDYESVKLTQVSENPSNWFGAIPQRNLTPQSDIYISANREFTMYTPNPPGHLVLLKGI